MSQYKNWLLEDDRVSVHVDGINFNFRHNVQTDSGAKAEPTQ
jgi:hypothetical protein